METRLKHVRWGAASRPKLSGPSGDAWLVLPRAEGVLVAALDALGHGPVAGASAAHACDLITANADGPLERILQHCHRGLKGTRGVAITAAVIDESNGTLSWLGLGNVQGWLHRARPGAAQVRPLLIRSGIVGRVLPGLTVERMPLAPHDTLILATDGVAPELIEGFSRSASPERDAERLLERHFRGDDDGLVLVVRFDGGDE